MNFRQVGGVANAPCEPKRMGLKALAAALVGWALAAAAPPPQNATPALWEVSDADTTIYLFGTFHALSPDIRWFDGKVASAFDRSEALVLETVVPSNPADIAAAGRRAAGGKATTFAKGTIAAVRQGVQQGLRVDQGADAFLKRHAEARGKPVSGLEGFEEQLVTLANIPAAPPASAVAAPQPSAPTVTMTDLLQSWKRGDDLAFASMLANFEAKSPVAYRMLIADRNAKWEQRIEAMLSRPGRTFVAVGAGHLSGRHSVIALLQARGLKVRRIA